MIQGTAESADDVLNLPARQSIARLVRCIAADKRGTMPRDVPHPLWRRYQRKAPDVDGRVEEAVKTIIHHLLSSDTIRAKWHADDLRSEVEKLLTGLSDPREMDIEATLDGMLMHFDHYPEQWVLCIPLKGLELGDRILQFGETYVEKVTRERINNLRRYFTDLAVRRAPPEEVDRYIDDTFKSFDLFLLDRTCALISVIGGEHRAREVHWRELNQTIELLRYCLMFMRDFRDTLNMDGLSIGIEGDYSPGAKYHMIFSNFLKQRESWLSGHVDAMELDDADEAAMREAGAFELSHIWRKPHPNSFEASLLNAVHWCADAMAQTDQDNRFLSLMVCLETLYGREIDPVTQQPKVPVTEAVVEGVAVTVESDREQRIAMRQMMSQAYNKRSKLSHGRERDASEHEVRTAVGAVIESMRFLVSKLRDWKSLDDFHSWVDGERERTAFPRYRAS